MKRYEFEGNTIFSNAQLLDAPAQTMNENDRETAVTRIADYMNREVSLDELGEVSSAVTRLYVNRGYINSGAVIPEQDVTDGVITIHVVEGRLSDINIHGNKRLRASYFHDRIRLGNVGPLNLNSLRDQLEVVRQNPNIERINASLHPGASAGQSYLDVDVTERDTKQFAISFNNHRPPSVGAERVELFASTQNLLGFGDALALRYGLTSGGIDDMEIAGVNGNDVQDFTIDYAIPLTARDVTLLFNIAKTDDVVIEEPFKELDITSETLSYSIGLRHPLWRTPKSELAVFLVGSIRQNQQFLLGDEFQFERTGENGESDVTVIRFGQEFSTRDTRRAFTLRSTFSFGVNAFGATDSGAVDGQFVAWLGQAQYMRRVADTDLQLILRGNAQFANDSLLAVEQFAVGGVDTVRGYRENLLVRDGGITSSIELRLPLIKSRPEVSILDVATFFDIGYAYNVDGRPTSELISSCGLGLLFHPNEHLQAEVYWGYPFNDLESGGDDLQDHGFHFDITWFVF